MMGTIWALVDAASGWALHAMVAVAALIALVLVARRPVAARFGAKAAYALWLLPAARLVLPPLPQGWRPWPELNGGAGAGAGLGVNGSRPVLERAAETPPEPAAASSSAAEPDLAAQADMAAPLVDAFAGLPLAAVACGLWAGGAAVMLALAALRQSRFVRMIDADSRPVSPHVEGVARDLSRRIGLRRVPVLRASLIAGGPMVTGLLRPVVLLPEWFETDYADAERRDALAHELTHLKRGDLWALQAAQIVLALQWCNPLAHLAMKAFRADQEAACDADVLRLAGARPQHYARTLVKAVRLSQPPRRAEAGLHLNHAVKDRLLQMQRPRPGASRRALGAALIATFGAAALVATASPGHAEDGELAGGDGGSERTSARLVELDGDQAMILIGDPFKHAEAAHAKIGAIEPPEFQAPEPCCEPLHVHTPPPPAPPAPPAPLAPPMRAIPGFQVETIETETGVRIVIPRQEFEIDGDADAWMAYALAVEEQAEAYAERMDAWSERVEAQAERMARQIEARMERAEARHERAAERFERDLKRRVERELEPILDDADEVISDLDDDCRDWISDGAEGPAEIAAARSARTGERFRAVCLAPDGPRPGGDAFRSMIQSHPDLDASEKAAVLGALSGESHGFYFRFD